MLDLLAGWKVKLAIIMLVLSSLFFWHQYEVKTAVVEATNAVELQYAKEKFKLIDRAQAETFALRDQVDAITKDKNVKVQALNARVATLTRSLSERPKRPASNGSVPGSTSNAESPGFVDASRLYRSDAEVAVWFAARTEGLKVHLETCYRQYDEVKDKLDKFKRDNTPKNE